MPFLTRPASSLALPRHLPPRPRIAVGWREWLAPLLSVGCFVHCVGMALLAPLLPTALSFLAGNELCEWGIWSSAAVSVSVAFWSQRSQMAGWLVSAWAGSLIAGMVSLVFACESVRQLSLLALLVVQLCVLAKRMRAHQKQCRGPDSGTTCCVEEE